MGEIAEMMLDGSLCEGCGSYIDDETLGYPRYCCEECAKGSGAMQSRRQQSMRRAPKPRER